MNYSDAAQEIKEILPDFENQLAGFMPQNSHSVIRTFTECIKNMIRQDDRNLLPECLRKMSRIYSDGDASLKNAVENIFIYSLDNFTAFCTGEYRKVIFSHISQDLQKCYTRQIYSHGI